MKRRKFITLAGAGVAGSTLLAGTFPTQSGEITLTFGHGSDDSGTIQVVIDKFNTRYKGKIRVTWKTLARESDTMHRQLVSNFNVESGEVDVFSADVPWTAEFSSKEYIKELTKGFYRDYTPEDFLTNTLKSTYYNYRMWGVPWYTDIGMLYYRRDLLAKSGFNSPPKTWSELSEMAIKVMADSGTQHGYVFQGADYEGGVANALEYIWNAGGRVLTGNISVAGSFGQRVIDPNVITVNSSNAAKGLDEVRTMISAGVVPKVVSEFRELESWEAFAGGNAVFMRNWPFAYGNLDNPELSKISPDQVGIAPIPVSSSSNRSYSCQGGWNLMINAYTTQEKQQAAWKFIRFMTAPEQQKYMALNGGFLPTYKSLYDDQEILAVMPSIRQGKEILENARVRPITPFYQQMAPRISRTFNRVLRGEMSGRLAVQTLEKELRIVLRKNR
ncbi:MAG: ABC transporter substrate-binding protein [Maribacter sp.]|nr:ABC transporter substrate-binding protein [Maribacter sp.]